MSKPYVHVETDNNICKDTIWQVILHMSGIYVTGRTCNTLESTCT